MNKNYGRFDVLRCRALATQCLLLLCLTSCTLSLGGTAGLEKYYTLYQTEPLAKSEKHIDKSILVRDMQADGFLRSRKILYSSTPGVISFYRLASWTDTPPRMMTSILKSMLNQRGYFKYAVGQNSGARADYQLSTTLLEMRQDTSTVPGKVVVKVRAELVDMQTREVIYTEIMEREEDILDHDIQSAAISLNRAVVETLESVSIEAETLRTRTNGDSRK